jgi:hypothetical protein
MESTLSLQSIPPDILAMLPEFLHTIEDYTNLASTCRILRVTMATATPKQILRLAVAQSNIFFRPDPLLLVAATVRQLGNWARLDWDNEIEFESACEDGSDSCGGLLDLAVEHCGLTLERIRELHLLRFSLINPAIDIVDRCVGVQWHAIENFWNGGASDAYDITADASTTLFHIVIYGELFGPDMEAFINQGSRAKHVLTSVRADFTGGCMTHEDTRALAHTIHSTRWTSHWKKMRTLAGPDFCENFVDSWAWEDDGPGYWRQRLWENVMLCQGLEGLQMLQPHLRSL